MNSRAMTLGALGLLWCGAAGFGADAPATPPPPSAIKSSCSHVKTLSKCVDFTAEAFAVLGEDFQKNACKGTNGTYAAPACPSEKAVGTCALGNGQFQRYYNDGAIPYKAESAQKDCKDLYDGKWLGGAAKADAGKK